MKKIFLIIMAAAWLISTAETAERRGMVICARSGNQSLFDTNRQYVRQTLALLKKSGIDHVQCFTEGGEQTVTGSREATADAIAAALRQTAVELKPADELWLFFYGYANATGTRFSLATSQRRMSGAELTELIGRIPAKKYLFCFNIQSYPLLELLKRKETFILSATSAEGQLNPPLLPGFLLSRWLTTPGRPFRDILKESARELQEYFLKNQMAVNESAVMAVGDELYRYPFETTSASSGPPGFAIAAAPPSLPVAAETISDKTEQNGAKRLPPTDASRQAIAEAKRTAAAYPAFSAVCLSSANDCTVNNDGSAITRISDRIYLNGDIGAERYSRLHFRDRPPFSEFRLLRATVIYSDGSAMPVKAERYSDRTGGATWALEFPALTAGSLIETEFEYSYRNESNIPAFQRGLTVQREIPVASWELKFRSPLRQQIFFRPVNGKPEQSQTKDSYSRVTTFRFSDIPAFEPLRYDPPADEILTRIMVSNTSSWESFADWARAMFEATDRLDHKTAALARQLCAGAATDAAKVKAIYEFLCNLRYDTTPSGVRAFRPRLPGEVCAEGFGDCKDKANALVAMAALVGVRGQVALVKRGGRVMPDFPSWQFNHAVAWFPQLTGYPQGLWCDPTDTSTVFGSLPPGDTGCDAWVMTDRGGTFRTIRNTDERRNILRQQIDFSVADDDKFTGTVIYTADGLQDYYLRRRFRDLTPLQQQQFAQDLLNACCRGATVKSLTHTPVNRLTEPFALKLEIAGDYWPLVRDNLQPPYDLWTPFSAPTRNRPLFLNDGRPLTISQTVKVNGSTLKGQGKWQGEAGPLKLQCTYDEKSRQRLLEAEITDGLIAPEVYARCVPLVHHWYGKMN